MAKKMINMASIVAAAATGAVDNAEAVTSAAVTKAKASAKAVPVAKEPAGVTANEGAALSAIVASKAPMTVPELAAKLKIDAQPVRGLVASLVKKSMVMNERTKFGTLYVATDIGADTAAMLK